MPTAAECLRGIERAEQQRRQRREQFDRYKAFYRSRAWRAARYKFLKTQPRPLRCLCCGATAQDVRLAVDHIVPIKKDWSRRLDPNNFQVLCATDCNLGKGSHDETDWKTASESEKEKTI
ncbi:MAG: HNH endonuclease [Xanthobacteraceae bacterium]